MAEVRAHQPDGVGFGLGGVPQNAAQLYSVHLMEGKNE